MEAIAGTYHPFLTLGVNLDSESNTLTAVWRYTQIGNVVTLSGRVNVRPILTKTFTVGYLTLPVPSNFSEYADLSGVGAIIKGGVACVDANYHLDLMEFSFTSDLLELLEVEIIAQYIVKG